MKNDFVINEKENIRIKNGEIHNMRNDESLVAVHTHTHTHTHTHR